MLDNPYYLAVGAALFVGCVFNAVFEYRNWKHTRRERKRELYESRLSENLAGYRLTPRDVLDIRELIGSVHQKR